MMTRRLTAIVEGKGYVALCPELDIASQGKTVAEARDNLAEALALFFETAPSGEVDRPLRDEVYVTQIEIAVGYTACPVRPRSLHSRRQRFRRGSGGAVVTSPCRRPMPMAHSPFRFRNTESCEPER